MTGEKQCQQSSRSQTKPSNLASERHAKLIRSENKKLAKPKFPKQKSLSFTHIFFSFTVTVQTAMQMLCLTLDLLPEY